MAETKETTKPVKEEPKRFKCKVFYINEDPENAKLPIIVHCVGHRKRQFYPGDEVVLHDYHISILRDAVDDTEIEVPDESGVYGASDPIKAAEKNFPGFIAKVNPMDNGITLIKRVPRYSIEMLGPA